jgi:predicted MFS family arabinose efflux permease
MSLASRLLVLILASFTLVIGFFVTFSLISGKESPFELFTKIEILKNLYLLFGILLIIGIIIFGVFLFFKEHFLRY